MATKILREGSCDDDANPKNAMQISNLNRLIYLPKQFKLNRQIKLEQTNQLIHPKSGWNIVRYANSLLIRHHQKTQHTLKSMA